MLQKTLRKAAYNFRYRLERVMQTRVWGHIEKNFVGFLITVLAKRLQNILHFYSLFIEIIHFKVVQELSPHHVNVCDIFTLPMGFNFFLSNILYPILLYYF